MALMMTRRKLQYYCKLNRSNSGVRSNDWIMNNQYPERDVGVLRTFCAACIFDLSDFYVCHVFILDMVFGNGIRSLSNQIQGIQLSLQ